MTSRGHTPISYQQSGAPAATIRIAGPMIISCLNTTCYNGFKCLGTYTSASKQTPQTKEHIFGAPECIPPSPSSENRGWGCSAERATGTACGSYPGAKQSKERAFPAPLLEPGRERARAPALSFPDRWDRAAEQHKQPNRVAVSDNPKAVLAPLP